MKVNTHLLPLFFLLTLLSCSQQKEETLASSENSSTKELPDTVRHALEAQGLIQKDSFRIAFDFRDKHYRARINQGEYDYFREFSDSTGAKVVDHRHNQGFVRTIDGDTIALAPKKAQAYSESVNSVVYFALLPYFLKDPAVQYQDLGIVEVEGEDYYKYQVTFRKEDGGTDHDDIFIYWFHAKTHVLDYLAYSYTRNGGGVRFRKAYNPRTVEGIRLVDYINYKHENPKFPVEQTDKAFEQGKLEEVSRIDLENAEVGF